MIALDSHTIAGVDDLHRLLTEHAIGEPGRLARAAARAADRDRGRARGVPPAPERLILGRGHRRSSSGRAQRPAPPRSIPQAAEPPRRKPGCDQGVRTCAPGRGPRATTCRREWSRMRFRLALPGLLLLAVLPAVRGACGRGERHVVDERRRRGAEPERDTRGPRAGAARRHGVRDLPRKGAGQRRTQALGQALVLVLPPARAAARAAHRAEGHALLSARARDRRRHAGRVPESRSRLSQRVQRLDGQALRSRQVSAGPDRHGAVRARRRDQPALRHPPRDARLRRRDAEPRDRAPGFGRRVHAAEAAGGHVHAARVESDAGPR